MFTKRELKIIDNLFDAAKLAAPVANARIVAGLVYKGELIALSGNQLKTHPFQKKFSRNDESPYLHAENNCILRALREYDKDILAKSKLFVIRAKKPAPRVHEMVYGLAKPCAGCMQAIKAYNIPHVFYSTNEGDIAYVCNNT